MTTRPWAIWACAYVVAGAGALVLANGREDGWAVGFAIVAIASAAIGWHFRAGSIALAITLPFSLMAMALPFGETNFSPTCCDGPVPMEAVAFGMALASFAVIVVAGLAGAAWERRSRRAA